MGRAPRAGRSEGSPGWQERRWFLAHPPGEVGGELPPPPPHQPALRRVGQSLGFLSLSPGSRPDAWHLPPEGSPPSSKPPQGTRPLSRPQQTLIPALTCWAALSQPLPASASASSPTQQGL